MNEDVVRKRKLSLYFPRDILAEMQMEADRLERSLGWVIQAAWRVAREQMMAEKGKPPKSTKPAKPANPVRTPPTKKS